MFAVTQDMIDAYQRDGVVLIKGLWTEWVDILRAGIDRNMANPSEYAAENLKPGEGGRFLMIIATGPEFLNSNRSYATRVQPM